MQPLNLIYGEVLAFYELRASERATDEQTEVYAVYSPLINRETPLGCIRGKWDASTPKAINGRHIRDIVGIWSAPSVSHRVYILRKHPGLSLLSPEETGVANLDIGGEELDL
jgi:hypothetical protein